MTISQAYDQLPELVTTNDVFTTFIDTEVPSNNQTIRVDMLVMARATDGTSAMWQVTGEVETTGGANLRAIPAGLINIFSPRKDVAAALWDADFTLSGKNIIVRVKGDPVKSVGWYLRGEIFAITH